MTKELILNRAQAEAVYSAMCTLNDVGGALKVTLPQKGKRFITSGNRVVVFDDDGYIKVRQIEDFLTTSDEFYDSQAAFAAAYNLLG